MKRHEFGWLKSQEIDGVPGIAVFGEKEKPSRKGLVITGTHGKEVPSGTRVFEVLRKGEAKILPGVQILFAVGNLPAVELFYAAEDDAARKKLRFTPNGSDMNRMPANPADLEKIGTPEAKRAIDLRRVLVSRKIDYVLDLHSQDQPSAPSALGIVGEEETRRLFAYMPIPLIINNVVPIQKMKGTKTQPLSAIIDPKCSIEVECGQTGSPECAAVALQMFNAWGRAAGLLEGSPQPLRGEFDVVDTVMAPDASYAVVDKKFLQEFAPVKKNNVLLRNTRGEEVTSPADGLLMWCPSALELDASDVASEVFWIVVPKK